MATDARRRQPRGATVQGPPNQALQVASVRSLEYLMDFTTRLDRWTNETFVIEFRHRARTELQVTTTS